MFERLVSRVVAKPKSLFVSDALGAFLSIGLLGFVLPRLQGVLGFPKNELYFLATIPAFFIVIDLIGIFRSPKGAMFWTRVIAVANLLYCIISLVTFWRSRTGVTPLGWGYVGAEVLVIGGIALFEILCAQRMDKASSR